MIEAAFEEARLPAPSSMPREEWLELLKEGDNGLRAFCALVTATAKWDVEFSRKADVELLPELFKQTLEQLY